MKDLHEDDMLGPVRERLGRYEEAPSADLWEKIAASQRKEKMRVWPVWVEAMSLLAIGVMLYSLDTDVTVAEKQVLIEPKKEIVQEQRALIVYNTEKKEVVITRNESIQENSIVAPPPTKIDSIYSPIVSPEEKPAENKRAEVAEAEAEAEVAEGVIPPFKKPKSKFQFYLSVTPSLSFQKIIPTGNDDLIVQGFENRSPLSIKRFGFGVDAGFQRDINNIFGFYGGLSFYRQDQQLTYFYYDKDADVTRIGESWTFEITRQQHSKTFDYTMTNIGVGSGLLMTLKGDKLKHKFGAGLLFSQGFAKENGSYHNSRSGYLSYQVFYRNEIRVNDHLSWFVEPTFTYSFISKEKLSEPFELKPYRAGIRAGVLYRF